MEIRTKPNRALNQLVRSNAVEWQRLAEPGISGVWVKVLRFDEAAGRAPTILLKFAAGSRYPAHNHPGGEEIFGLEGEVRVGGHTVRPGDFLYTPPEGKHAVSSRLGGLVLLTLSKPIEILTGDEPQDRE